MKSGTPPRTPFRAPLPKRIARSVVARTLKALHSVNDAHFDRHQATLLRFDPAAGPRRGRVLLSHRIEAFTMAPDNPYLLTHTMFAEVVTLVELLRARGFEVHVISHLRRQPVRGARYDLFLSTRGNFDHIAPGLNADCIKVVHLDTMHWLFNNHASLARSLEVQRTRGITPERDIALITNRAIEGADYATVIGNRDVYETYAFAKKPVFELPHPALTTFPWPEDKDFEACRTRFLWMGSRGLAHKGLGRVLEAFAAMPEMHLTVCGPLDREPYFVQAYHRELHETPNITAHGWIDITGPDFAALAAATLALVYPSCAEAQAGASVNCLQAGLVPVVSRETGLDVDPAFGVLLADSSVETIIAAVRALSARPAPELAAMARAAWDHARATYTPEHYQRVYGAVLDHILAEHPDAAAPGFVRIPETLARAAGPDRAAAE